MFALPQPCPNDHATDRRFFEDVARRNVGHRNAVLAGHAVHRSQQILKQVPTPGHLDESPVLHLRPGLKPLPGRVRFSEPALGQESPGDRPKDQQLDPVLQAQPGHVLLGAPVEQREADLVGHNVDPAVDRDAQVGRVEIGQPQVGDAPFILEFLQPEQAIQPTWIRIAPGVELQQIQAFGLQALQRAFNGNPHVLAGDRSRFGHPLGQGLNRLAALMISPEQAGNHLRRSIMIGHIKCGEPRLDIGRHRRRRRLQVQLAAVPLHIRDLPQSREHARDAQARRQFVMLYSGNHNPLQSC